MTFEEMAKDFLDFGKQVADDAKLPEEIARQRVTEKLIALFEIAHAKGRRQAQAEVSQEVSARIHELERRLENPRQYDPGRLAALTDLRKRLES